MTEKIWANSGDSHVLEPADVFTARLPAALADRAPTTVRDERHETIYVDGQTVFRTLQSFADGSRDRVPGAFDPALRLKDLDEEGVINQILFPSVGLWVYRMTDQELWRECARGLQRLPRRGGDDGVASPGRCRDVSAGRHRRCRRGAAAQCRSWLPGDDAGDDATQGRDYNDETWEPLWAAAEEAGVTLAFHVGTGADPRMYRGAGAVVINYVETFLPGQRTVSILTASGALDRHPGLRVFIAEGGASWVPALADRMDEGYRQHGGFASPKLSRLPSEIIDSQVYASFQHDVSAVPAFEAMRYPSAVRRRLPALEAYGHTQETLHHLFDAVDADTRERFLIANFDRLLGTTTTVPAAPRHR